MTTMRVVPMAPGGYGVEVDFLLEREPATSILPEFSLVDVSRYFPDFPKELRRRLA